MLLQTTKNSNNNHKDNDDYSHNKDYIEKILNKDKENLNERHDDDSDVSISNNDVRNLENENDFVNGDIHLNKNHHSKGYIDDKLQILKNNRKRKRKRRDGKIYCIIK